MAKIKYRAITTTNLLTEGVIIQSNFISAVLILRHQENLLMAVGMVEDNGRFMPIIYVPELRQFDSGTTSFKPSSSYSSQLEFYFGENYRDVKGVQYVVNDTIIASMGEVSDNVYSLSYRNKFDFASAPTIMALLCSKYNSRFVCVTYSADTAEFTTYMENPPATFTRNGEDLVGLNVYPTSMIDELRDNLSFHQSALYADVAASEAANREITQAVPGITNTVVNDVTTYFVSR